MIMRTENNTAEPSYRRISSIILPLLLMLLPGVGLHASKPNWSVNPNAFTYSMNVTAKFSVNCVDLADTADMVGAFVAGQCRGVTRSSNIINGNYLAFLTIYSNSFGGEQVDLKVYDSSLDSVFDIGVSLIFQDGAILGDPGNPYYLHTNEPPTDLLLSKTSVRETQVDPFIGLLSTIDLDSQNHSYQLVSGVGDTNNSTFHVTNDSLFAIGSFDYDLKRYYSIRISTSDGGCTLEKIFQITVKDSNHLPTDILLSSKEIDENNTINEMVGILSTVDNDDVDQHSYELVNGIGDDDNGSFTINGDELQINVVTDFESQRTYSILIESDDGDSGTVSLNFLIEVLDINEKPRIRDTLLVLSENLKVNQTAVELMLLDPDQGDSHSWQILGSSPFTISGGVIVLTKDLDFEVQDLWEFQVVVTDLGGLSDTADITIQVMDEVEPEEGLPVNEVISPNGDGINDYFQIEEIQLYTDFKLQIFNRNAVIIYEVASGYDNSWGGTYMGKPVDSGVYYYLFQSNVDASQKFTGAISIIR